MTHKYNMNDDKGIWQKKETPPPETMSNDKLLQKVLMLDMGGPLVFVADPKQASKCAALGNNILWQQPWCSFSFYRNSHSNPMTANKTQANSILTTLLLL